MKIGHIEWIQQTEDMQSFRIEICVTRGMNDVEVAILDDNNKDLIKGVSFPSIEKAKEIVAEVLDHMETVFIMRGYRMWKRIENDFLGNPAKGKAQKQTSRKNRKNESKN